MKRLIVALLLVAGLGEGSALAQNYPVWSMSQPYVPLTGAAPVPVSNLLNGSATMPLPFAFPFYGTSYTSVTVNVNGLVTFGNPAACVTYCTYPYTTPGTGTPNNLIAAWWRNLRGIAPGEIRSTQTASEFTVEWADWSYYSTTYGNGTFSFQIKLTSTGMIQVHYGTHTGTGPSASYGTGAGFENSTGTLGAKLLACSPTCHLIDWPTNTLFTIGQPEQADLTVLQVNLSNMVKDAGTLSFDVAPTFRNFGQTDAGDFSWKAYLSTDRTLEADGGSSDGGYPDSLIHSSTSSLVCPALSSVTDTASVTLAPEPPPGQYYVLVHADPTDLVIEASDTNNVGSTATYFTQGIDLVATSVSGPASSAAGSTIAVTPAWFNQGTDAAPVPVVYKLYLSPTTTPNPSADFVLATFTVNVGGGQAFSSPVTFSVPQNVPGGDFYYVLGIDPADRVAEASELNNVVVSSAKVAMLQADLVIDEVEFLDPVTEAPVRLGYFGETARVRVTMHNAGGADALASFVGVVISIDANLSLLSDTIAHDEPVPPLAAGASATVSFNLTLPLTNGRVPPKTFTTGNYYLFGMLDSFGTVTELGESNNNLVVSGAVTLRSPGQDYRAVRVEAPSSAAVDEVAQVFRVIRNVGNVAGAQASYRYYASANPIVTTQDTLLRIVGADGTLSDSGTVSLGAGAEDSRTELVRLPATMASGTYYFGCIVDPGGLVAELDETNNAVGSLFSVQVAPAALRIATSLLPDATTGQPYAFRLAATGEAGPSTWTIDTPPADLALAADGTLSGTPSLPAINGFTVVVKNGAREASARLVLRVLPPTSELEITTRALPPVVNSPVIPYQGTLGASGGLEPYHFSVVAGTLPNGILLSTEGVFSGAARAGTVIGERTLTFEVRDAAGTRAYATVKLKVVVPGALLVKNLTIPDSLVNYDYLTDLAAMNSDGSALAVPLLWTLASGELPPGITLSTAGGDRGILQGKPSVAGTYSFSIQVEDSKGRSDSADFIVRVFPTQFRVSAVNLPGVLHPGDAVDFMLTATSPSPVTTRFSLYAGTLPPGLTLAESGQVSGTVAEEGAIGVYNFVARAKDGAGGSGLAPFKLQVTAVVKTPGCSAAPGAGAGLLWLLGAAPLWLASRRRRASR